MQLQGKHGGLMSSLSRKRAIVNQLYNSIVRHIKSKSSGVEGSFEEGKSCQETIAKKIGRSPKAGQSALIELGISSGLSLVFALLQQNWSGANQLQGTKPVVLCNQVWPLVPQFFPVCFLEKNILTSIERISFSFVHCIDFFRPVPDPW